MTREHQVRRPEFASLDGLRGIAILVIVLFHTGRLSGAPDCQVLHLLANYGGFFGNYLFFMLSGFLISCNYRSRIQQDDLSFGEFFYRRLSKLLPLYWLTNVVALALSMLSNGMTSFNAKQVILVAFMLVGGTLEDSYPFNVPTWFICTLTVCYITYFALARVARKTSAAYLMASIACVLWGYVLMRYGFEFPFAYTHTGEGLCNFFIGVLMAERYPKALVHPSTCRNVIRVVFLVAILAIASVTGVSQLSGGDPRFLFSVVICPIVICLTIEAKPIRLLLSSRPFIYLGSISMPIFYWHLIIFSMLGLTPLFLVVPAGLSYLIYLSATLLIVLLSHYVLEKRLNDLFSLVIPSPQPHQRNRKIC